MLKKAPIKSHARCPETAAELRCWLPASHKGAHLHLLKKQDNGLVWEKRPVKPEVANKMRWHWAHYGNNGLAKVQEKS